MTFPTFLPDGNYDLSNVEKREAAAEACLRFIAVLPQAYFGKGSDYCRDQMAETARQMIDWLKEAQNHEYLKDMEKMKILRLLVTDECNRNCSGCCNYQWELQKLPEAEDYRGYDQILLTGGEPMLYPALVVEVLRHIRAQTAMTPVYLYTADVSTPSALSLLGLLDGMTVTLHAQRDVIPFVGFAAQCFLKGYHKTKSLRVNTFKEVNFPLEALTQMGLLEGWKVKPDVVWEVNCPLPEGEVFMRYKYAVSI